MEVAGDTTVRIILVANKASLKFRIYSGDKPLKNVTLYLETDSLTTSITGVVLFRDLTRFEAYEWSAFKAGYENLSGSLELENDTTVNLTMNLLTLLKYPDQYVLSCYPNPVSSTLHIESPDRIRRIEICDLRGAVLDHLNTNEKNVEIDLSGFPQGIYIAKIYRDGLRTANLKIIKSK